MRTVSDCIMWRGAAGLASVRGISAPSAVTQGIVAAHVPDAGPEHGSRSEGDSSADPVMVASCVALAIVMPGMERSAAWEAMLPDIGAMPGTTHTAPPATMLRCPTNRAIRSPAECRMRRSIT